MNLQSRISRLEAMQPPPSRPDRDTDEQRLRSMETLAQAIAEEMTRQGIAPADVPAAALPLAIAEVLNNDKP